MRYRMAILAGTLAVIAGGAGAAAGSYVAITAITEPSNGVITSCYKTTGGAIRMVNPGVVCAAGEKKLTWASNIKPKVHLVGAVGEPAYDHPPGRRTTVRRLGTPRSTRTHAGVVHLTGLACRKDSGNPSSCTVATLIGGTLPIFTLPVGSALLASCYSPP